MSALDPQMNIEDYLIDHSGFAWTDLLDDWRWLVPSSAAVWLMNRFAELVLVLGDGSVSYLATSAGALRNIASSPQDLIVKIDKDENVREWLMMPLVDRCVAAGMTLAANQCYGFTHPPRLGGKHDIANVESADIAGYLAFMGQVHRQIRDLPDGTPIKPVALG